MIREIQVDDFDKGYLELLFELSHFKYETTKQDFENYLKGNNHIFVIEKEGKIIGAGSLFIMKKLHCNPFGQIEDVVITNSERGNGLGKKIINHLVEFAKFKGCYKIVLNSLDNNIGFYNKCNFLKTASQMTFQML